MKIEETLAERSFMINAQDPYDEGLEILNKFDGLGDVVVHKNNLSSNGPVKEGNIEFHVSKGLDSYSNLRIIIEIATKKKYNKTGTLDISMKSVFEVKIDEGKMFGSIFQNYYLSGPIKLAKDSAGKLNKQASEYIRSHKIFS